MAKTAQQIINMKGQGEPIAFPVKTGETIYKGTLAAVGADGYLYNMDSTAAIDARIIVVVADETANTSGPAATTASGSISGANEVASAIAGDKTVRYCYTKGQYLLAFTAIAQSDLGKVVYATDNYTLDESMTGGVKVGTLVTYISATSGWVDLNVFYQSNGAILYKGNLTAATSTAAGGVIRWANPTGETIMIELMLLDVTSGSTGAATLDVGVAANGTTSSDLLIDGCTASLAKVLSNVVNGGTNGRIAKATSGQYVTGTASATVAGLVGTYGIVYRLWE